MARRAGLEEKLSALLALRSAEPDERLRGLERALAERSNLLVAKAAGIASENGYRELVPALLAAYDGLFGDDCAARDPLVQAKDAIARALHALDHRDPAPFLRGMVHVQMEPVWGSVADAAAPLRCACAAALPDTDLPRGDALRALVPRLVDPFTIVRVDAAAAIAQIGGDEAALLLRLKALAGDPEAEVLGACFSALLQLEPASAVAFIAPFVDGDKRDAAAEAAAALASARDPAALPHVRRILLTPGRSDVRVAAVLACAGSRLPDVADLLVDLVAGDDRALAVHAVDALAQSRFRDAARERTRAAVAKSGDRNLAAAYARAFD